MDAGIDCVAITDHNSGAWVDELKAAYETMRNTGATTFRELHLFPGVEISVNSGFHLLAILGPERTTSDVDTLLGAIDYRSVKGESSGVTHKSAVEVVEAVLNAGGVPIPAHVEADKGLLRVKDGDARKPAIDANTIRQILANQNMHAMEVVDRTVPKAALYDGAKVDWCEVLGSDCHSFRGDNAPGGRYTWVKMETPSLEGLRLALMDGARFSIRRSDEPQPVYAARTLRGSGGDRRRSVHGAPRGCKDRVQSAAQRSGWGARHWQVHRGARVENRGAARG